MVWVASRPTIDEVVLVGSRTERGCVMERAGNCPLRCKAAFANWLGEPADAAWLGVTG